ncbi:juvenile hormone epoxide hydrolase-like [Cydia amplana]|uniref:juvenile hormone epoxide hydrolase-like n=1 Tax=Cydia amplana TaxID=1869771 RepID=UPI002FE5B56C
MISDLRYRIHYRRNFTRALHGVANTYGTHSAYLAHFLDHWANKYDFRAREDWLNSFPQYVTNIQGLDIHFIHVRPPNPRKKVLPILLLHGFPVTAFEFVHVIQNLMEERDDCDFVFEIVVPHLPGYGYSEATYKPGMALYQMGIIMKNLMLRLRKPRFYIHAGDMGHVVGDAIATLFPERVLGFHTNLPISNRPQSLTKWVLGQLYPPAVVDARYEERMYPLSTRLQEYLEHFGYFHMQATKPDNLGHGLDESPVALTSWLLEIFIMGTDPTGQFVIDGNLSQHYDMDDWLDTFTIYWASQSVTTAVRSYAEFMALRRDPLSFGILIYFKSPVALVSWLLENIMMGTDRTGQFVIDGNLSHYDMDDWLDTFTIYWASQSVTTAVRSYAEFLALRRDPLSFGILMTPTPVLFAAINFRYEIVYMPDDFLRDKYPNLVQTTTLDFGGHFAAYQVPAVLADSIWTSVAKMEMVRRNQGAKP